MKAATKSEARHLKDLYEAILSLESVEEVRKFFIDLCTPAELSAMADRWRVVKLIEREVPYRKIYEKTGVSTATVTRVARTLTHGTGGYGIVLDRIKSSASGADPGQDETG